jgi:hypothetical protein
MEYVQLSLSVATLILTPIASAVVIRHQMKKSHDWWLQQQEYLEEKEITKRRFDLYETIVSCVTRLITLELDQQVFIFSRNKCEYVLHHCPKEHQTNMQFIEGEYHRYNGLIIQQNSLLREAKSQFQTNAFVALAYYGADFQALSSSLMPTIKSASDQLIPLSEIIEIINDGLKRNLSLNVSQSLLDPIFDQRWDDINYNGAVAAFLAGLFKLLPVPKTPR